jgi:CTP:molybdopterin cytidylyltransferase MocA
MVRSLDLAVVVLAAGAGTRYGGEPGMKLLGVLHGRPILAHVLGEIHRFGAGATVVVLGDAAETIEAAIDWVDEIRVRNLTPQRGLASSIQLGIDSLRALPTEFDGAFIVLGDQPFLRAETMQALAAAASRDESAEHPIVVPRYGAHEGPRNPVLLLRPAWTQVDAIEGDNGLGTVIAERPESVLEVPIRGKMPDVDTRADLERLEHLDRRDLRAW